MAVANEQLGRFLNLWHAARAIEHSGGPGSLSRLQLTAVTRLVDDRRRQDRLTILGTTTRQAIEDLLFPASYAPRPRLNRNGSRTVRRGPGAGGRNPFLGQPCEELLIVPFYDGDREICGFAARDLHSDRVRDFLIHSFAPRRGGRREAGLAMLPLADEKEHVQLADSLFVFLDLETGLKLQLKHLQSSQRPLPIVVARDDSRFCTTAATWQQVRQSDRVLVCEAANEHVLRQAYFANARIVVDSKVMRRIIGPPINSHATMFQVSAFEALQQQAVEYYYSPLGLLTSLRKRALSRQTVMLQHLLTLPPEAALELLERVLPEPWERHQFLGECSYYFRSHLAIAGGPHLFELRAQIGKQVVVERSGTWFIDGNGKRICDRIRVDRVLRCVNSPDIVEGHIMVAGERHAFQLPLEVAERSLLLALQRLLSKRAVPFDYRRGWSKRAYSIATRFSRPSEVYNADVLGWTGTTYRLPAFTITSRGIDDQAPAPLIPRTAPALNLAPPRPIQQQRMRPVTFNSSGTRLFWAVVRGMITMLATPVLRQAPQGLLLVGEQATALRDVIGEAFGCNRARYSLFTAQEKSETEPRRTWHRWPLVIELPKSALLAAKAIAIPPPDNIVAAWPSPTIGYVAAGGWWIIEATDIGDAARLIKDFAADVVLSFVPELLRRQQELCQDPAGAHPAVWQSFREWWPCRGRRAIEACGQLIRLVPVTCIAQPKIPTQSAGNAEAAMIAPTALIGGKDYTTVGDLRYQEAEERVQLLKVQP